MRRTPNQTDSDVTCSRSYDQGTIAKKDWKIIRVEKKQILKKTTYLFFLIRFLDFFLKKQVFVLFLKKHKNPILNDFY